MGDDHPCNVEGIGTICIKMFDEIVRELKEKPKKTSEKNWTK